MLAAGLGVLVLALFPGDSPAMSVAYTVSVALSSLFLLLAVRQVPAPRRRPWNWLLVSVGLCVAGEVLVLVMTLRGTNRWPSPADILFVLSYLALAWGVIGLHRQDNSRRASAARLDAGIVATGVGVLCLVHFVLPVVADSAQPVATRLAGAVYPLIDVLLLFIVVRTLLGARRLGPALAWVVASLTATLSADAGQIAEQGAGGRDGSGWMDVVWAASYLFLGLAAASAQRPEKAGAATEGQTAELSLPRLAILALAAGLPSGVLTVRALNGRYDDSVLLGLGSIVLLAMVVGRVRDLLRQLRRQSEQLARMARTDPLTEIANRRSWDFDLDRAMEHSRQSGRLLVALLDLDHFKEFNDARGHQAGDDLLKEAARAWSLQLGPHSRIARWGGEEFAVLITCADLDAGQATLERLRELVPFGQTASVGAAVWDGREDATSLLHRADDALYEAKRAGRDRLVLAGTHSSAGAE
ncbi:GGDEF domain-containing protein [Kineosporia rhizophila]|uniref:GGDEF domain-containing protein n=1 Tax=Kineosporia rhizophila TaxID=84633 RepID=UPI001E5EA179|nr:GGDEF domain-containing protein [Kineosporia rhizophila]MCE0539513.1 GGDEF domain-containing protein [Kineosporia rhizophila]